jgi:hypothetical protein
MAGIPKNENVSLSSKAARPIRSTVIHRAVTALVFIWALSMLGWDSTTPARSSRVTLLYVGASDCAPCRKWQQGDGTRFLQSADFAHLTYREVKSPSLLDVLNDENWPEDLRKYRERLGRGSAVPLWLLIRGDDVVAEGIGESQWRDTILPRIRAVAR